MNNMGMYYEVKGYNNGECLVSALFFTFIEALAFVKISKKVDCDIWLKFNGKVVCEIDYHKH